MRRQPRDRRRPAACERARGGAKGEGDLLFNYVYGRVNLEQPAFIVASAGAADAGALAADASAALGAALGAALPTQDAGVSSVATANAALPVASVVSAPTAARSAAFVARRATGRPLSLGARHRTGTSTRSSEVVRVRRLAERRRPGSASDRSRAKMGCFLSVLTHSAPHDFRGFA